MRLRNEVNVGKDLDISIGGILGYFEFQVGELCYFVIFDASVVDRSTDQNGMVLDCGERIVRDCYVDYDVEQVRSADKQSYEMEASTRGDDWLGIGDMRSILRV